MQKNKSLFFGILCGIILSIISVNINLNKFDVIDQNSHLMISGDINLIWKEAEQFKLDILNGKNFLVSGKEYLRTYFPSKLIALYSILTGSELFSNFNKSIPNTGNKFIFLLFQIIFYYLSLFYLYKKLIKFYVDYKIANYIILFLSLEPTILQYHGTFWTESIYFSLQILLLGTILKINKTSFDFIIIGFLLGVMYLQKTVTIFLIIPIAFYFVSIKINYKFKKIFLMISMYLLILFSLGLSNYMKTGIFYILPIQTKDAHYIYLLPQIFEKNKSSETYQEFKFTKENNWKKLNNYDEKNFKDLYKFYNFRQSLALEEIKKNKLITIEIYIKKSFHHVLLNPMQNYYWHEYNKAKYKVQYHLSDDKKKWVIWRIIYSLLIFAIIFIGFIRIIKSSNKLEFHMFLVICAIYYSFMLGWIGNTRYFMPSMIILSIFFGNGIHSILNFYKKK